jgi:Protein of unknown function (DUF4238)
MARASEPRAHHFVPRFWLAGFTSTGQQDGELWATDLVRAKQWPTNPANAGHRRDFYRISDPEVKDPVVVEKRLSQIEDAIAPLLKRLDQKQRRITKDEMEALATFMAVQFVRVPAVRPVLLGIADSIHRAEFSRYLRSPESWAAALKKAGIPADAPGAEYERSREFERSGQYSLTAGTDWYLDRGFKMVQGIVKSLMARHWGMSFSPSGSFIGSDNPVSLEGPKGKMVGFKNADFVFFPVSRHVLIYVTKERVRAPLVSRMYVAHQNTFTMLTAETQVYSHTSDFCWLDEQKKYRTDWKLFSKEKFL